MSLRGGFWASSLVASSSSNVALWTGVCLQRGSHTACINAAAASTARLR